MEEDWVVLCQALYQSIGEEEWTKMHEKLKKRGFGQGGVAKDGDEDFLLSKEGLEAAFIKKARTSGVPPGYLECRYS